MPSNFRRLLTTKLKSLALSGKLVKVSCSSKHEIMNQAWQVSLSGMQVIWEPMNCQVETNGSVNGQRRGLCRSMSLPGALVNCELVLKVVV